MEEKCKYLLTIVATWRKNGCLTPKYGGASRPDLYLKIDQVN